MIPRDRERRQPVIAIDGPMGSGKSTVAKAVARRLHYRYIDTGAMYRSVAWMALQRDVDLRNEKLVVPVARALRIEFVAVGDEQRVVVDGEDVTEAIRTPEVSEGASVVSMYPGVREAMVALQRQLGSGGGVVMEGRDIGTVVFPDAEVKIYLDASPAERARRRYEELRKKGAPVDFETLRRAEEERDKRDSTREYSPLRRAADAVVIDSTGSAVEATVERVLELARRRQ